MSRPPINPSNPGADDALLQRYQEANAMDPARPGDRLREAVLAHARSQTATHNAPIKPRQEAANDSHWKLRALGSLAVVGLMGLLVMQFDRGTPEEQAVALGTPSLRADTAPAQPEAEPLTEASTAEAAAPTEAAKAIQPPEAPPAVAASVTPPPPTPMRPAPAAKAAPPATPQPAEAMAPMPAAQRTDTVELTEAPPTANRAAPAATMDAAPAMTQAETTAPMASAPAPAARERQGFSEPRKTARREMATEDALGSARDAASPQMPPPLHAAVASGNLEQVQTLLAQGANINARDRQGRTALMLAAMGASKELVDTLMTAGADASLRDAAGLSAADHATQAGHADWLRLLQPPLR